MRDSGRNDDAERIDLAPVQYDTLGLPGVLVRPRINATNVVIIITSEDALALNPDLTGPDVRWLLAQIITVRVG